MIHGKQVNQLISPIHPELRFTVDVLDWRLDLGLVLGGRSGSEFWFCAILMFMDYWWFIMFIIDIYYVYWYLLCLLLVIYYGDSSNQYDTSLSYWWFIASHNFLQKSAALNSQTAVCLAAWHRQPTPQPQPHIRTKRWRNSFNLDGGIVYSSEP